ncbi:MAG TPA: c-type cytochrome [Burkholderiaceae bacterium]
MARTRARGLRTFALALLAFCSQPILGAGLSERQAALLANNCLQCHARPGIGVPLIGDAEQWKRRNAEKDGSMLKHVVEGYRGMPPLGYCSACSTEDLLALIDYISGRTSHAGTPQTPAGGKP